MIVSPTPTVITIKFDELSGQVDMMNTKDIPFHVLMIIFGQLIANIASNIARANAGIVVPGLEKKEPAPNGNQETQ